MNTMIEKIKEMIEEKKMIQMVVLDNDGMVVEAMGDVYEIDDISSLFSPFLGLLDDIQKILQNEGIDEFTVRTKEKQNRVVIRFFAVGDMKFLLIAIFPIPSYYRQVTNEIIRLFHERFRDSVSEDSVSGLFASEKEEMDEDMDILQREENGEVIHPVQSSELSNGVKDVIQKITEEIKKSKIVKVDEHSLDATEETIDLIGQILLKKLSSTVVEKMVQKTILQTAQKLISREVLAIKKEMDLIFSP